MKRKKSKNYTKLNSIETDDIYKLFVDNKFKTLYGKLKSTPELLTNIINDNKTIVHYSIQTNNLKLLKKMIKLDDTILTKKLSDDTYIPNIALDSGFEKTFFYLIDEFINKISPNTDSSTGSNTNSSTESDTNSSTGSNTNSSTGSNTNSSTESDTYKDMIDKLFDSLTISVIIKKNWSILYKYIDRYNQYINWLSLSNKYSLLYIIVNLYYEHIDIIIKIFEPIIKKYKKQNISDIFKYPIEDNTLFFLIYLYYKPEQLIQNNKSINNFKLEKKQLEKFIDLYPQQLNFPNQVNKTPIYYIAEFNDLELLKYCIELGADVNHISPLGYSNFAHSVMKTSNNEIVKYVLNLEINLNHLDANNETPIYNLLRNKYCNTSIDLITKLLKLTTNWDMQNMYGQSIIHLLVMRSDIEQFYNILSTRYFDINLKNKVGSSPIQILETNFQNQKLDPEQTSKKLLAFKELVADNYINILSDTSTTVNIPTNIKSDCNNYSYKVDDPNRMKTSCWISTMNNLSKASLTDLDKLSKNYIDLIIDDYQFAHYNLYNARDSDIYTYYQILMSKHRTLGIPLNDESFDINKALDISIIKPSSQEINNNIEYMQSLFTNTLKYPMLYPLNIYWINETNYIIPYNITKCVMNIINLGRKFIICRINIIGYVLHANILLIDTLNKRLIRFEPQGGIDKDNFHILDNKILETFNKDKFFKSYTYFKPTDYEPINGLQSISQETNNLYVRKGDMGGFCLAWCMWWVEFYIENIHNELLTDKNLKLLIQKVIKRIINNGYLLSEYIRNYANYMHQKLIANLSIDTLPLNVLYYEKYTDKEIDIIYKRINKDYLNIT